MERESWHEVMLDLALVCTRERRPLQPEFRAALREIFADELVSAGAPDPVPAPRSAQLTVLGGLRGALKRAIRRLFQALGLDVRRAVVG